MKVECVQTKLLEALKKVEKVSSKSSTLPILSAVFLEATNSSLVMRSTNLELGIEITIPVKIESEGSVAVHASSFVQYISSLKGRNVSIRLEDKVLSVESEKQKASFNTLDAEDFPTIPQVTGTSASVSSEKLKDGFKSVFYSASVSSIKPELSSVYVTGTKDGHLIFVATDSFRLAEKKIQEKSVEDFDPLLIPFKNVVEIERLLEGVNSSVEVVFGENQIAFIYDSVYLTSRVVDGSFPDYTKIIPTSSTTKVVALKSELIDAFKTSTIFSGKFNKVTFSAEPEESALTLEARSADVGENRVVLSVVVEGEPVVVDFNYRYISDAFQSITSDSVELLFNVGKPLVVRGVGQQDFTYIVMPMNR